VNETIFEHVIKTISNVSAVVSEWEGFTEKEIGNLNAGQVFPLMSTYRTYPVDVLKVSFNLMYICIVRASVKRGNEMRFSILCILRLLS
jgi:hypothetical protein